MRQVIYVCCALALTVSDIVFSVSGEISATNQPLPGVFIHSETRTNPPTRMFVAEVNLKNPDLHLRVSRGGPDPDGPGKWQTTLLEPTKIAAREDFDFVVNGDFFQAHGVNDGEGTNAAFRANQWSLVEGPAMTDGKTWSTSDKPRPCLVVHTNHSVTIETRTTPESDAFEVIGGNTLLVKDGVDVAPADKTRHPRTAVGLNATGDKLIILLVDGRKPGIAVGLTYEELATEMRRLGCQQALNLDGGGSSAMAVRDATTGQMKILNEPTDGHERAVANVLGISVEKP
jgi:exopolysaccharide biosynthesis protein